MELAFEYIRKRREFGQPCFFDDNVPSKTFASIPTRYDTTHLFVLQLIIDFDIEIMLGFPSRRQRMHRHFLALLLSD